VACAACGPAAAGAAATGRRQPVAAHQATHRSAPLAPLHALSITPAKLGPQTPITVTLNRPPREKVTTDATAASVLPAISPAVPGNWSTSGARLLFTPAQAYPPDVTLTVSVSAALGGPLNARLTAPTGSVLRAQQILAGLGYLPLEFTGPPVTGAAAQAAAAFTPPAGTFTWRWPDVPPTLRTMWAPGDSGNMTRGAVMAFQHLNGLPMDGVLGPVTWSALLAAATAGRPDPEQYSYIYADINLPQTLTLWVAGKTVLTSPVNSGVAAAPSIDGTFPIYERFTSAAMKGTNPNGTTYDDPGVPWINYYNGGQAVHGFPRASYGYPQSVGCLELPIPTAAQVYSRVDYGTLVTVYGTPF
jgi:peptidoglycan hydrolase-like protein with peptidoglycan-binding domain